MSRRAATTAALALLFAMAGRTAGASTATVTWTQAPSGPPRLGNAAAFDPDTALGTEGVLVSFGGNVQGVYQGSTLLFDPAWTDPAKAWTTILAPARRAATYPRSRAWAGMDWDPGRARVILFGGTYGQSLQDTWAFDPRTRSWSPLVTNCRRFVCPPARWGHGMTWSSARGATVVFAGGAGSTVLDDLWAYGGSWGRLQPVASGPSGRRAFGMAEDPATGLILVYGGLAAGDAPLSDTWLLDPVSLTWTRVATATVPDTRAGMAMSWLPSIGMIVMTGGQDDTGNPTTSTWAFDPTVSPSGDWVRLAASGASPSARGFGSTLTADTLGGSAISFGDPSNGWGTATDNTWIVR